MGWKTLDDMDMDGRRVLVRIDLNVPLRNGRVADATRIERIVPTIRDIQAAGGRPILLSHLGRPQGRPTPTMSLEQIRPTLEMALGQSVGFAGAGGDARQVAAQVADMQAGDVLLLENLRFDPGEVANADGFCAWLASLGDVYVNDAFSVSHRAHASIEGVAHLLPACAGRQMEAELTALEAVLGTPQRPVIAVVGGAKVSTKLALLGNLIAKVEKLVIGGAMANTFLAAEGLCVGRSLAEHNMAPLARAIMDKASEIGCEIILPSDVVVACVLKAHAEHETVPAGACPPDAMILDAGPETVARITTAIRACRTLVWNGPLGAFEFEPFDAATNAAAAEAARQTRAHGLVSVAGGGDTVAALNQAGVAGDFSYVSTAGGAFLEWMEGRILPGVAAIGG